MRRETMNVDAEDVRPGDYVVESTATVKEVNNSEEFWTWLTFTKGAGFKHLPKVATVTVIRELPTHRCEAFNIKRMGMCREPLTERGECPRQGDHGDEFAERSKR